MPKETLDKLVWLFLLLPGFLCVSVIGLIVDLGQLSEFQITFYSFILTLLIVVVALPLAAGLGRLASRYRPGWPTPGGANYLFFASSVVVAAALGLGLGMAAEGDSFFLTLRSLPITEVLNKRSSSRPLVFLLSQNTTGQLKQSGDGRPSAAKQTEAWARVHMKEGPSYEGWPEFYAVGHAPTELYLSPACRVSEDNASATAIRGPGIILVEGEIRAIELLDRASSPCYALYFSSSPQPAPVHRKHP